METLRLEKSSVAGTSSVNRQASKRPDSGPLHKPSRRKQCMPASRKNISVVIKAEQNCQQLNKNASDKPAEQGESRRKKECKASCSTADSRQDSACRNKKCSDTLSASSVEQSEDLDEKPDTNTAFAGSRQAEKWSGNKRKRQNPRNSRISSAASEVHTCQVCCAAFSSVQELKCHLESDEFRCKLKCSSTIESYHTHEPRASTADREDRCLASPDRMSFVCSVCSSCFQSKPELDQHMSIDASILNNVLSKKWSQALPDVLCQTVLDRLVQTAHINSTETASRSPSVCKNGEEILLEDSGDGDDNDEECQVNAGQDDEAGPLIEEDDVEVRGGGENETDLDEEILDDDEDDVEEDDEETLAEDGGNASSFDDEINGFNSNSESTDQREFDDDDESEDEGGDISLMSKPLLASTRTDASASNEDEVATLLSTDDTTLSANNEPSSVVGASQGSVSRRKANRPKPVKIHQSPSQTLEENSSALRLEQSKLQDSSEGTTGSSPRLCWCSMCGQELPSEELLSAHIAEHEKLFPFFCALCDANFMEGQLLKTHVATKHTVEHSLQCQTCGMHFKQRGSLSTHTKYCRQAPACIVCAVRFPNSEELEKHYYTHSEEERAAAETLACMECGEIFLSTVQLKEHMKTHGELRPYWCDLCGATFTQQRSLDKHRQLHRRQQDCRCEICGVQLLTRSGYVAHKRAHRNMGTIQLGLGDGAEKVTLDKNTKPVSVKEEKKKPGEMDTHKYFKIIEEELSKTTDSASLSFVANTAQDDSNGRMHNKVHSCPFCPLTCSSADRLQTHIRRLHREAKLEQCEVCSRRFYGTEYMEKHKRSHSNLGDMFPCDQCSKVFKRKWSLETHRKIHSFQKFLRCDICGEEFRFVSEVEKHKNRKHQYDKTQVSYECNVCHLKFATLSHLSVHSSHSHDTTDGNPFKCGECEETFLTCTELKKHIYHKHEGKLHEPGRKQEALDSHQGPTSSPSKPDSRKRQKNVQPSGSAAKVGSTSAPPETPVPPDENAAVQISPEVSSVDGGSEDTSGMALGVDAYNELTRQSMIQARLQKRFACEMCLKCFATKSDLRTHMRTHTGETPYKCDYCDRAFKQRGHRKLHIQVTHTRDMPYPCQLCGQAFPTRYRYQIHLKRHSGIKEHECPFCDKAYYTVGKLNEHKRKNHAKEMGQ